MGKVHFFREKLAQDLLFVRRNPELFPAVAVELWWVAFLLDHYSRRVLSCAVFRQPPTAVALRCFLGRAV
jgi:hypothetical protein